ncbi:MAG: TlpA family protein disulfide reductase [Actinobacteria bacterium]|nr:MAG: TlpA family protein disulfide reductase [Actinomycetota bacterium]
MSSIQSPRHLLIKSIRLSATLLVLALFALLSYRIVHGLSGARAAARMTRAITSHRAPPAPNLRLSVIWPQAGTWPQRLRASAHRGTLRLGDLRGYPVVLNFWASWCSPCQREAALLAAAAKARRGRVAFIGVDVNDLTGDARHFLRLHDVPYVAVHSGRSIANRFGLIGLPETFYVDRQGRIEEVMRGELSATKLQRALGRVFQN